MKKEQFSLCVPPTFVYSEYQVLSESPTRPLATFFIAFLRPLPPFGRIIEKNAFSWPGFTSYSRVTRAFLAWDEKPRF